MIEFRRTHLNFVINYIMKKEKKVTGTGGSNAASFIPGVL